MEWREVHVGRGGGGGRGRKVGKRREGRREEGDERVTERVEGSNHVFVLVMFTKTVKVNQNKSS